MKEQRDIWRGTPVGRLPLFRTLHPEPRGSFLAQWSAGISCAGNALLHKGLLRLIVFHGVARCLAVRRAGDIDPIADLRAGEWR